MSKETPARRRAGVSFFVFALTLGGWGPQLYAQNNWDVSGDEIQYNTHSKSVIASQNVEIQYKTHRIQTQYASFDVTSQNISIPATFNYQNQDQDAHVTGSRMLYHVKTHEGNIHHLQAKLNNSSITGERMSIEANRLVIHDLTFSTCEKPTPDYIIRSELVHFYPQVGFMVAFNNTLSTPYLPFPLWIPTYIYGSRSYSIIGSSSAIPEVGANNREGLYIKHRIGYFFNERSTGTVDLGWYIERGGFLYGFTHLLETSNSSEVHLEAHMAGRDGFAGLAAYYTDLVTIQNEDSTAHDTAENPFLGLLQNFKNNTSKVASRLHTGVSHRQLRNDSRVSHTPFVKLLLHDTEVVDHWKLSGDIGWANTKEETPTDNIHEDQNIHSQLTLGTTHPVAPSTNIGSALVSNMNWYGNHKTWQRLYASFYLELPVMTLQPRFFYIKKLMQPYGESPFEYERKYATVSDELGLRVDVPLWGLEWGYEAFYDLDRHNMRTQNIRTSFRFDCWKLSIKANTIEGNFSFDVELL